MITIKNGFGRERETTKDDFKYLCATETLVSALPHSQKCDDLNFETDIPEYSRANFSKAQYMQTQSAPVIGPIDTEIEHCEDDCRSMMNMPDTINIENDYSPNFERDNQCDEMRMNMNEGGNWDFNFIRVNMRERDGATHDFTVKKKFNETSTDKPFENNNVQCNGRYTRGPGRSSGSGRMNRRPDRRSDRRSSRRGGSGEISGSCSLGNFSSISPTHRFKSHSNNMSVLRTLGSKKSRYYDKRKKSIMIAKLIEILRGKAVSNITDSIWSSISSIYAGKQLNRRHGQIHGQRHGRRRDGQQRSASKADAAVLEQQGAAGRVSAGGIRDAGGATRCRPRQAPHRAWAGVWDLTRASAAAGRGRVRPPASSR